MRGVGPVVLAAGLATTSVLSACQPMAQPDTGILVTPTVPFLTSEVARALHSLRDARGGLPGDASEARGALDEAEAALERLQAYYLPLVEARQRAVNARQLGARGQRVRAGAELESIESTLLTIAGQSDDMGREVEKPLDLVEEGRVALASGSPEASARLDALTENLELMLLKGDLIVH